MGRMSSERVADMYVRAVLSVPRCVCVQLRAARLCCAVLCCTVLATCALRLLRLLAVLCGSGCV